MEKLNPTVTTASLLIAYPGTEIYEKGKQRGWWDDSIWLKKCTGKKFHNYVPIYPSKNMTLSQLFSASAEINYWWNKKKNNFDLKSTLGVVKGLIKRRDFLKLYTMSKSVIFRTLRDFI